MATPATAQRWIWLDMEMSGLDPDRDRVLEIAMAITDTQLEIVAEAPVLVIHQSDVVLAGMDEWNQKTHARTGLIDKVRASTLTEAQAEEQLLSFLAPLVTKNSSPMCGNSICQDRRFMARHLPALEEYFHYRNLDVSTPKELAKAWRPDVSKEIATIKTSRHEALADVYESIAELKIYRSLFFRLDVPLPPI